MIVPVLHHKLFEPTKVSDGLDLKASAKDQIPHPKPKL